VVHHHRRGAAIRAESGARALGVGGDHLVGPNGPWPAGRDDDVPAEPPPGGDEGDGVEPGPEDDEAGRRANDLEEHLDVAARDGD
jgi:hypothetical protein